MEAIVVRQPFHFSKENELFFDEHKVEQTTKPWADLLDKCPKGTYTSMRTVNKTSILELDLHVHRLVESCKHLKEMQPISLSDKETKDLIIRSVNLALREFRQILGHLSIDQEVKIAAVLCMVEDDPTLVDDFHKRPDDCHGSLSYMYSLLLHVSPLAAFPSSVIAEVRDLKREVPNPNIKSVEWVKIKKEYENKKGEGVNEVLFPVEGIREGLTSNFFVIDDQDNIVTAPDDLVLDGSIRRLVLDICKQNGIKIKFESPSLQTVHSWKAAFITSNSRLMLPIKTLNFPEFGGTEKSFTFGNIKQVPLFTKLKDLAENEMIKRSVKVLE